MAAKVAHLSDEAHAMASNYCAEHGLRMKEWVSSLILGAIEGKAEPVRATVPETSAKPSPVLKKAAERSRDDAQEGDQPWSKPPFWKLPKANDESC